VNRVVTIGLVAGEASGDQLGWKLMQALRAARPDIAFRFVGVGGEGMAAEGLVSLFPLADIAVMGILPVLARLPLVLRRIRETAAALIDAAPDGLVVIDSPDFTHRVAKRVRKALPTLPIIDYVSPTVWAWRPGRARAMRAYADHVLALLPFEPEAHRRLGGPPCTYVGHPLIERLSELRPDASEAARRENAPPLLLVLPGSRRSEVTRLLDVFGVTVARTVEQYGSAIEVVIPAVPHVEPDIRAGTAHWTVQPRIVLDQGQKRAAFRSARAALAASGTVSLELALAGVPMVVAYKVSKIEEWALKPLITAPSIVLPNLILGRNAIPEFIQERCEPETLASALVPLLRESAERAAQLTALAELDERMSTGAETPSARAARVVLSCLPQA
jgi:lipid-A-disaccharide synthase